MVVDGGTVVAVFDGAVVGVGVVVLVVVVTETGSAAEAATTVSGGGTGAAVVVVGTVVDVVRSTVVAAVSTTALAGVVTSVGVVVFDTAFTPRVNVAAASTELARAIRFSVLRHINPSPEQRPDPAATPPR